MTGFVKRKIRYIVFLCVFIIGYGGLVYFAAPLYVNIYVGVYTAGGLIALLFSGDDGKRKKTSNVILNLYNALSLFIAYFNDHFSFLKAKMDTQTSIHRELEKRFFSAIKKKETVLHALSLNEKDHVNINEPIITDEMLEGLRELFDELTYLRDHLFSIIPGEQVQYNPGMDREEIKKVLLEMTFLHEMIIKLLKGNSENIRKAADPLSSELLEIKQGISEFLHNVEKWRDDLSNENSGKNFSNIIATFKTQKKDFNMLTTNVMDENAELQKSLEKVQSLIDEVVGCTAEIEDVSSKINILSLNASIEAARAGEYGRGFKIIAGETKKLSDETNALLSTVVTAVSEAKEVVTDTLMIISRANPLIAEKIESQRITCIKCNDALNQYYDDFHMIFNAIHQITDKIYRHIDKINPVFQVHDSCDQELNNMAKIIDEIAGQNIEVTNDIVQKIDADKKNMIINDLITVIERKITTDSEVEALGEYARSHGIERGTDIKKGDVQIELF